MGANLGINLKNIFVIIAILKAHHFTTWVFQNASTKENETLLAVGTAYVQGEDVAARGRVLLFSFGSTGDNSQNLVCLVGPTTW